MAKQNLKRHGTKTALLTSTLSLLLCVAMLIGTTLAWFTDSVTSGDNQIIAGNLDMEVTHVNAKVTDPESIQDATNLWNKDSSGNDILWEPGVVSYETFTVKNAGTLALTYKLVLNQLADSKYNTVVSTDDSNGKSLKDVLYVHTVTGAAAAARPATKMAEDDKTIAELLSTDASILSGNLEAGKSSDALTVYIYWPTDSGNECNLQNGKYASDATAETVGKLWINLSVTATATQYTHESDSFDNQYDAKADEDDSFEEDNNPYLTFSSDAAFTLGLDEKACYATGLETSTDTKTWSAFKANGSTMPSVTAVKNDTDGKYYVYLRGKGMTSLCNEKYTQVTTLTLSGSSVDCSGSVMTLLDYDNPNVTMDAYAFASLFDNCTALKSAPALPATTLADYCYEDMFCECTALTTAPALPATTLAKGCYDSMFYKCTALTTAPALPATMLADHCYEDMFYNCTALTTAPTLPATTLAASCYDSMFKRCTSLKVTTTQEGNTAFFTCPLEIPDNAVKDMFKMTSGEYTGAPLAGVTYYYSTAA